MAPDPNHPLQEFFIREQPFYHPLGRETEAFLSAAACRLPALLKGPTGCGKTRFLQAMAHRLDRALITVACHEDLTASDLVGRWLFRDEETIWMDGPLTLAARHGGICYLDEIVEARKDAMVVIHPLTDDRRILSLEKKGEVLSAHPDFMLVMSYNPGYQSILKDLKQSTRQRFVALDFHYPEEKDEIEIATRESGLDPASAGVLVRLARRIRSLKDYGLEEGLGTRLIVYAGRLARQGLPLSLAVETAMIAPITDDRDLRRAMSDIAQEMIPPDREAE